MKFALALIAIVAGASALSVPVKRLNEVWSREQELANGVVHESRSLPTPAEYVNLADLPASFTWGDVNGTNMLTKSLNQHIPQYCGSCWAHGAISSLGDRIKIARKGEGIDINLSIQYILNCGTAGSCHGGSASATFQFIKESQDSKGGVPYDTCNPYLACSSESKEGLCSAGNWECGAENVCRTCSTFTSSGGKCSGIAKYPNATIAEYGSVRGEADIMKEIYTRGPVAAGIDASQILEYTGGVAGGKCGGIDHIVSIVGWGVDAASSKKFWIVRNSWGEFWGELGYIRVERGNDALCLEDLVSWATPATWTEHNYPCFEDGSNCVSHKQYVDPAVSGKTHPTSM